jgi:hypothetical protein
MEAVGIRSTWNNHVIASEGDRSVPHGTIRPPRTESHSQTVVPRETSCILRRRLLDSRSRGNVWPES